MRTLLTLLFLGSLLQCAIAQDTLYKMSGETIGVKVLEVSPKEVKYVLSSNSEGPTYIILKSDVYMIEYANGSKDVFGSKTITPKETSSEIGDPPKLTDEEKMYRKKRGGGVAGVVIGSVGIAVTTPFLVTGIINMAASADKNKALTQPIVSGMFTIISIAILGVGIDKLIDASVLRSRMDRQPISFQISPELMNATTYNGPLLNTGNGIGLGLTITF